MGHYIDPWMNKLGMCLEHDNRAQFTDSSTVPCELNSLEDARRWVYQDKFSLFSFLYIAYLINKILQSVASKFTIFWSYWCWWFESSLYKPFSFFLFQLPTELPMYICNALENHSRGQTLNACVELVARWSFIRFAQMKTSIRVSAMGRLISEERCSFV